MGRSATCAANGSDARNQFAGMKITLSAPCTGELHPLIIGIRKIQRKAHGAAKVQNFRPLIDKMYTASDNATLIENGIKKFCHQSGHRIF